MINSNKYNNNNSDQYFLFAIYDSLKATITPIYTFA